MLFAVLFTDNPEHADARDRHMPEHLAFLQRHRASIRAAGPLSETSAGGTPAGGLWLVDAENAAAVRALVEEDPLWPTGLRRSVRIMAWRRVFADDRQDPPQS